MGINKVEDFLESVVSEVHSKEVHEEIKEEMKSHIEEMAEEYMAGGFSEEEAYTKAVANMGDGEAIGLKLDKVYKRKPEWRTISFGILFMLIGLIVNLIIIDNKMEVVGASYYSISSTLIAYGVGIGIATWIYFIDYRNLERFSLWIFIGTTVILIILYLLGSPTRGGSFIYIPFFSGVNLFPITLVTYTIATVGIIKNMDFSKKFNYINVTIMLLIVDFLYIKANSKISFFIFNVILLFILFSTKSIKKIYPIALILFNFIISGVLILSEPYKLMRLMSFINKSDPEGSGYLNNMIGKYLGQSHWFYQNTNSEIYKELPNLNNDFILNFITYRFGRITFIILLGAMVFYVVTIFRLSRNVKNTFGKMLTRAFGVYYLVSFAMSILLSLNLMPIISLSVPFLTLSGSSTITNCFIIGLISSIYGRKNISRSLNKKAIIQDRL